MDSLDAICKKCGKPICSGRVETYYAGMAFSCSICDNQFADGLSAVRRCHGINCIGKDRVFYPRTTGRTRVFAAWKKWLSIFDALQ